MKKDTVRKYTVLIADGEPMARSAMSRLVSGHPAFEVAGVAATAQEARALAERLRPVVVVVDVGLGVALIPELLRLASGPALMAVARDVGLVAMQRVLRAGAVSCVARTDDVASYEEALLLAVIGRRFLGMRAQARLVDDLADGSLELNGGDAAALSAREREIFALLGEGLRTRAVAERLGVSVKTIETHEGRMKVKLGVPSVAALARRALMAAGRVEG